MAGSLARRYTPWILLFFELPLALAAGQTQSTQCYWPNGNEAGGWIPCSDGPASNCCHHTAICMSNGLCLGTIPSVLSRGACTDQSWNSTNCTQYCQTINPEAGCSIVLYEITNTLPSYCCNSIISSSDKAVCGAGTPFSVPDGVPIAGVGALAAMVLNTTTEGSSDTTSAAPPSSSTTSSSTSSSSTSAPSATELGGAAAPNCNASAAPGQQQPSRETAVGVGVGVPLGAIAMGLLVWAMREQRKRRRAEQGLAVAQGLDAAAMKDFAASNAQWQQGPPPSFSQSQRQSRIRELYGHREPAELI
ncbi:hypothetical protein CONLIGDRAFT_716748 [Coniochaeta ligniaria NRRL 30616]|uniref:Mid2 domain-containing protein n=1 Tax=Coniochaeta ligniaria NRRL 30616 TaxID=1408157 RepID=A0A1J7IG84_9PEZI|nr:hypothetical protein CONLIGDRAFT_716748 [Coniochaeta ligniaria NRRL 30616]